MEPYVISDLAKSGSIEEEKNINTRFENLLISYKKSPHQRKNCIELEQIDEILDKKLDTEEAKLFLERFNKENCYKYDDPEMQNHIEFIRWVKKNGGVLNKSKLRVYEKNYRGIHATVDIKNGEDIILIPIDLAVSYKNLLSEYEIGKKMLDANLFDKKWTSYIFPLIYILEELQNPKSKHKEWLEIIPKKSDTHPMFFNETEKTWLQNSPLLGISKLL